MNKSSRKGLMLVLSSPSGAGKTTLCKKIVTLDKKISMSISFTTRPKRRSEKDGVDYVFISQQKFDSLKKENFFIEYANVFDHWYGTPKTTIEENLAMGHDMIFDIDWQGAQKLSDFSKNDVVSIFILPPSNNELLKRLKKRAEDSSDIVSKRMSKAKSEISHWIEYDYVLVNKELDQCIAEIITILTVERKRRSRQKFIYDFIDKLLE